MTAGTSKTTVKLNLEIRTRCAIRFDIFLNIADEAF